MNHRGHREEGRWVLCNRCLFFRPCASGTDPISSPLFSSLCPLCPLWFNPVVVPPLEDLLTQRVAGTQRQGGDGLRRWRRGLTPPEHQQAG